jgi:hypothetical protein
MAFKLLILMTAMIGYLLQQLFVSKNHECWVSECVDLLLQLLHAGWVKTSKLAFLSRQSFRPTRSIKMLRIDLHVRCR